MPKYAEIVIETLYHYREKSAYLLHEFVLMPDHLHLILTPSPAVSLEKATQLIKGGSSFQINRRRERKMRVWQEGFHDWTIRDVEDWRAKAEYIALNPVRARLAQSFQDWPYSSASGRFVLDPMPAHFSRLSSGAKAPEASPLTRGLKPPPPKENSSRECLSRNEALRHAAPGAKAQGAAASMSDLKPACAGRVRPPKEASPPTASGAKAPVVDASARGLKPPPPKQTSAQIPSGAEAQGAAPVMSDLKVRPPKDKPSRPSGRAPIQPHGEAR